MQVEPKYNIGVHGGLIAITDDKQVSGIEFLYDYFGGRHQDASLLDVRREVCVSMMLGRVGLALEYPEALAATADMFVQTKTDYMAAYRDHGAAILRHVVLCNAAHGPTTLLRVACTTVEKIQDREVQARQDVYALHDLFINKQPAAVQDAVKTGYDRLSHTTRWGEILKRNRRGIAANPDGLVTLAERYLVGATLTLLDTEEAQLIASKKSTL